MSAVPAPHDGATESGPTEQSATALPARDQAGALRSEILSPVTLARTVDRIAHQILERHGEDDIVLLGIPTRGVHLARRLAGRLATFAGPSAGRISVGSLDITLYRDDLRRHPPRALEETSLPDDGIDNAVVVLVDDVLYSGRTVRAALDALRDHGRPRIVQLAVLVDRGHRQLPIRADYVGKNIPTAFTDDVAVRMVETDGVDSVDLVRRDAGGPVSGAARPTAGSDRR
ncbi:bifunctional pyr operon transcriptional regulator/uracil phosphoribosyltransferase PyrR [Nakamurella flavida]|uniref:Bifunctional protein PyrR n=1 Tax=Nakamurella flavida TaxID=363630 RepID=A0A938YLY0_9ACTN|nr:bifunctional pyr operon transcriptional regulator/uracil phosphoribosyltransferase PyrR [Nakamurella flavida]MBM9476966.1 bifunctional pyr operon transcriptional regulator/uracil phosphoribosyltransferase PyrR [Nakamurella flavida]MDP9779911.1 pyrimidine operon attenuation protein/uracil phosphoribosyltransferase [Nakamurella flavida]